MTDILSDAELTTLRADIRDFAQEHLTRVSDHMDFEDRFPRDLYTHLARYGILAPLAAGRLGRPHMGLRGAAVAIEELSAACPAFALSVQLANFASGFLWRYGNEEQRELAASVGRGESIVSVALSEPAGGSDLASISSEATEVESGYRVSGYKSFVNLGAEAEWSIALVRTGADEGHNSLSSILLSRGDPGYRIARPVDFLGMRGLGSVDLAFTDCEVPKSRIIGQLGRGSRQTLSMLEAGRIAVAAQCIGVAKRAILLAVRQMRTRVVASEPIASRQGLQFQLADLEARVLAVGELSDKAARLHDAGRTCIKEAAAAKLLGSQVASDAASFALQMYGAAGYESGHPAARLFRDARATHIYEGTDEVQRIVIARARLAEGPA